MQWKTVDYSKNKINNAGKIIRNKKCTDDEYESAIKIINNWRVAHAYPMHVFYMNLRRKATGKKDILVAERLKRQKSIISKLEHEDRMELWRMQDLGGCRLIVNTVDEVYQYATEYKKSRVKHIFRKENDYIKNPKISGYRSLHLVYQYKSDRRDTYNDKNILIELQFRTHLQHLWATAVETMSIVRHEWLKSGQGDENVLRFFTLVSSLFALKEGTPTVPGTPTEQEDLVSELSQINARYNILGKIGAISNFTKKDAEIQSGKYGYYLLILDYRDTSDISYIWYPPGSLEKANNDYTEKEKASRHDENIDVVLVGGNSLNNLKKAYPNYFVDIKEFISTVDYYLKDDDIHAISKIDQ